MSSTEGEPLSSTMNGTTDDYKDQVGDDGEIENEADGGDTEKEEVANMTDQGTEPVPATDDSKPDEDETDIIGDTPQNEKQDDDIEKDTEEKKETVDESESLDIDSPTDRMKLLEEQLREAKSTIRIFTDERDALKVHSDLNGKTPANDNSSNQDNELMTDLQKQLEEQVIQRAEFESELMQTQKDLEDTKDQLTSIKDIHEATYMEKIRLEEEISKLRSLQQDSETNETIHTSRINEAKKKESVLVRENKKLTLSNQHLTEEQTRLSSELHTITSQKNKLDATIHKIKTKCVDRVKIAETNLREERQLNEERKQKMKVFVETKSTELRIAKQHETEYFHELQECRQKLKLTRQELEDVMNENQHKDARIADVHAQLSRFKRDSERYLKMGDTLNQELESSMLQSQEHMKKRSLAKTELMNVLKKLEMEQGVSGKLRDGLKFTFLPKALSQQQLVQESIEAMDAEIDALAKKTGKVAPGTSLDVLEFLNPNSTHSKSSASSSASASSSSPAKNKLESDANRLISNLEHETQRVSQGIMALQSTLERLHFLISEEGDRNCCGQLTFLLTQYANVSQQHEKVDQEDQDHMVI